jgi:hypothetical protein
LVGVDRYASIEGKKVRLSNKHQLQQLLVILCYVLFSIAIAFPINNWRRELGDVLKADHLESVSIYMMQRDKPPEGEYKIDITDLLKEQGWTERNTTLVHSAWSIVTVNLKCYVSSQMLSLT